MSANCYLHVCPTVVRVEPLDAGTVSTAVRAWRLAGHVTRIIEASFCRAPPRVSHGNLMPRHRLTFEHWTNLDKREPPKTFPISRGYLPTTDTCGWSMFERVRDNDNGKLW